MTRVAHISDRAARAGVAAPPDVVNALASYLDLLAKWNRTINLTALPLEPATDDAIDRLIVEPLLAARQVRPEDRFAVDIGSGGGSPAVPMRLACPRLDLILTEVKSRKAAFLRAVVRELGLERVEVENRPFELVATRPDLEGRVDLVTMRAVRFDAGLARHAMQVLQPHGRLLRFTSVADAERGVTASTPALEGWDVSQAALAGSSLLETWTCGRS